MFDEDPFAATGFATYRQLMTTMSRKVLAARVRAGTIVRVCHGVYALAPPDVLGRFDAVQSIAGVRLVACMNTAAALHGFDTEADDRLHILDPGVRMRPSPSLSVHQRVGAPLQRIDGRLVTAPAWTAVQLARALRRPRALAVLDAALRVGPCTAADLVAAAREQKGRRGIVIVRELLAYADGRSESPMESEARLVFIDGRLPPPELQFEIVDLHGRLWRTDFAWPSAKLVAEYESMEWHANPVALKHDRLKIARLQECGWMSVPITVDDVRRWPSELVARIEGHLERRAA